MEYKLEFCMHCQKMTVSCRSEKQSSWVHIMYAYQHYWLRHKASRIIFLAYFTMVKFDWALKLYDNTPIDDDNTVDKKPMSIIILNEKTDWNKFEIHRVKHPRLT